MRRIESDMLKCVYNYRAANLGNTRVYNDLNGGGKVTLFGNPIAYFDENLFVTLQDGGWRTVTTKSRTTKSRLNALLNNTGYRIRARDFEWRLCYFGEDRGPFVNDTTFYIGDIA